MARNIYSRQQYKLKQRGFSEADAQRISYFSQRAKGNLALGSYQLSEEGKYYSSLDSLQRKLLRRAKKEGRPAFHYMIVGDKVIVKPAYRKKGM